MHNKYFTIFYFTISQCQLTIYKTVSQLLLLVIIKLKQTTTLIIKMSSDLKKIVKNIN